MSSRSISFCPPDIGDAEIEEVCDVLRSGWITTGPKTKLLERRLSAYFETGRVDVDTEKNVSKWDKKTVCLNSATAAEELNLKILGVGPGDEVIVPAYTYTATAAAAIHCGAKVVFVDIQKNGNPYTGMPEMDYESVEDAITEKTKVIIPVDIGGLVCDYDKLYQIVKNKKGLFCAKKTDGTLLGNLSSRIQHSIGTIAIVADCAHSLGAARIMSFGGDGRDYVSDKRYCGRIAHFSSFSFHAVKNLTTAEGGAATWLPIEGVENNEIYDMYQRLSLHGQSKDAYSKSKAGAWEYDIVGPWYKCNMTDISAAIGLCQLNRYEKMLKKRREIISRYDQLCDEIGVNHLTHFTENTISSGHLYMVRIPEINEEIRNDIISKLAEFGVSSNVHYKPLPMMTAYKEMGWDIKTFPNAYAYYANQITLPLYSKLSDGDIDYICKVLKKVLSNYL